MSTVQVDPINLLRMSETIRELRRENDKLESRALAAEKLLEEAIKAKEDFHASGYTIIGALEKELEEARAVIEEAEKTMTEVMDLFDKGYAGLPPPLMRLDDAISRIAAFRRGGEGK